LRAGLLFVSEEDGAVVGFACATRMEAYVHLHEMSVHPDYGRRGIGGALLARVVEAARSQHAVGVTLTTFADVPWNRPFYERHGFSSPSSNSIPAFLKGMVAAETGAGMTERIAMVRSFGAREEGRRRPRRTGPSGS
ncbi:MAG: GNAT family N-acetyltransferase, partial [Bacteroidota bacterium]